MSSFRLIAVGVSFVVSWCAASASAAGPDRGAFFKQHCTACHDSATHEGGLDLTSLKPDFADPHAFERWVRVYDRISSGEMPPAGETRPPQADVAAVTSALGDELMRADRARLDRDGRTGVRRLSRVEFEWTLRDLLGLPGLRIQSDLPADGKSDGFDRSADALDFSFIHMERYLAAVDAALDAATPAFAEKPPVFSYHWTPWLEGSSKFAILVGSKEGIGLIGMERDPTFEAKYPNIIDEEPKATAVGVFRHGDADFRYSMRHIVPVVDGPHRIRVSGYSIAWDGKKVVPTERHACLSFGIFSEGINYGLVDLPPNKAGVAELKAWLHRGGGMTHGVDDTLYFTAESNERIRDYGHKKKELLGPPMAAPGVAIEWIEISGPHFEQWPPPSQTALFGDLPVELWTAESGVPKPAQQTWTRHKHPSTKPTDIYGGKGDKRQAVHVVSREPEKDARRLLAEFLRRAFRRAVAEPELAKYEKIVVERRNAGDHFQDALKAAYRAALTSPDFILVGARHDKFTLASRLSYMLWSSMPDDALLAAAEQGSLDTAGGIQSQAERMLTDPKAARFVDDFTGQWLRLREIDATQPDKQLYPEFTPLLQQSMLAETRAYFAELLRRDLGAAHFVKSDFAMLNEPLAQLYGIKDVKGHDLRRVALAADAVRGPLLAQGSVLKITANGTTSSPVTRGAFVMEKLLGIVPTPPPPDAGAIEPDTRGATTIREQLAQHQRSATCAACHAKMDPYGFALETFDVIGEARTKYRVRGGSGRDEDKKIVHGRPIEYHFDKPVDCSGTLPDGRPFAGYVELRNMLAADDERLARAFVGHLTSYATGTPVGFADRYEVDRILARSRDGKYGVRKLVVETIASPLFKQN